MWIKEVSDRQQYGALDVVDRAWLYYPDSTVRIVGWETPVSVIFARGKQVLLRLKRTIVTYADGADVGDETERRRCMTRFRQTGDTSRRALAAEELEALLSSDVCFEEEYRLSEEAPYIRDTAQSVWFPVSADAVLFVYSSIVTGEPLRTGIVRAFDGSCAYTTLGFDGRLYFERRDGIYVAAYAQYDQPQPWVTEKTYRPYRTLTLYREYAVVNGEHCYDYDGNYLEERSTHHRCCAELHRLYDKLRKRPTHERKRRVGVSVSDSVRMVVELPPLKAVSRYLVADVLIPAMKAERIADLRKTATMETLIEMIEYAESDAPFYEILERLMRMNRLRECGGTGRGICSRELMAHLRVFRKAIPKARFAALLNDEANLVHELCCRHQHVEKGELSIWL